MNLNIRPMHSSDLDGILTIAAASPEAPQWQPNAYAAYLPAEAQPPLYRIARIADADGHVLAFAAATLLLDGQQDLCHLDSIAVAPDARRQGLATALVGAILAWAAENGARHLSLEVRASNAAAIALYRRLGLHEEGRRPRYYADPEEDALLLGRAVTDVLPSGGFPP
jgi:ribosomal-protein-alanine N-acetyltransferase